MESLSRSEIERYTRQIALSEVGEEGQLRLKSSSVLIIGVGGLGSPIATLLVSSGIGRVGIVDFDIVSLSNLPRQTLYTTDDIGRSKVECARERLEKINPSCKIESYNMRLEEQGADELFARYDMVVDGCDNRATRYIIDSVTKRLGIPYIYGAIRGFEGQVSIFNTQGAASYSELYPQEQVGEESPAPSVMATTPAIVGAIQANEAIKLALGYHNTLAGKLLALDLRSYAFNLLTI